MFGVTDCWSCIFASKIYEHIDEYIDDPLGWLLNKMLHVYVAMQTQLFISEIVFVFHSTSDVNVS